MFKKPLIASIAALALFQGVAQAQTPAEVNNLEISYIAYTANNIDISFAYLTIAAPENPAIRELAQNNHTAVNGQVLAILAELGVAPPVAIGTAPEIPFLQLSGLANVLVQASGQEPVDQITRFINVTIYPVYPDRNYPTIISFKMLMASKEAGRIMLGQPGKLLVQITNQDRTEHFMMLNHFTSFTAFPVNSSLKLLRSNLVNSPLARFLAQKFTGILGSS